MNNLILAINPGSSSVKFGLFGSQANVVIGLCRGVIEGIGSNLKLTIRSTPSFDRDLGLGQEIQDTDTCQLKNKNTDKLATVDDAYELIEQWLSANVNPEQISQVCYRIVHGGDYFDAPVKVDEQVVSKLESLIPFAPLHQPFGLKAIKLFKKHFAKSRHFACFDTAFHRAMPKLAQSFSLPARFYKQGIKRYGFHGLSYQSIVEQLKEFEHGKLPHRVVIAHLGSGASMCALQRGKSIATSMSFSPLDGLPMATRCGSLDPSAVLYMIEQLKLSTSEVSNVLNNESGLLGLSALSGDVRELMKSDDTNAKFALDYYIYQVCRELGAMIGTLEGLDALVFTGGIGAHNHLIREIVCQKYTWLGILLEPTANSINESIISNSASSIKVYCIKTDEELMMAQLVSAGENQQTTVCAVDK